MESHRYDDIIHLPHHRSPTRARMSDADRAAQFAPFAALTGFGAAIRETGRLTQACPELDESRKEALDLRLQLLLAHLGERPPVTLTYFQPDSRKAGGAILTAADRICKIDCHTRSLYLSRGQCIPLEQVLELESPLLAPLEDMIP